MEECYPKWIYHKTLGEKVVNSKEDHDAQGPGWEETPAAFDQKSDEKAEKSPADKKEAGKELETADFAEMTKAEIIEFLASKGVDEKDLKKLSKDQLIAKVGEI